MARITCSTNIKKGDLGDCGNYRPISVVCVAYKLFAIILLERLKAADAEKRVWSTQFGFRSGCGTADALFLTRRCIDKAVQSQKGGLLLLALDWSKASDSIAPNVLFNALLRFGIPVCCIDMIRAVYTNRSFYVKEGTNESEYHTQASGIVQGCPLSSFLFSIVMSILVRDARRLWEQRAGERRREEEPEDPNVDELLYADDTLLLSIDSQHLQEYMTCVREIGSEYGLAFNWKKTELLDAGHGGSVHKPDGELLRGKQSILYLGSLLSADGHIVSKLIRRIGLAEQVFKELSKVWNHTNTTRRRKLEVFQACVVSKSMHSLHTAWLNKAERQCLDAFQARCLRRILKIPPSYVSRVSNETVLSIAGGCPLSHTLLQSQLLFYGHVAREPPTSPRNWRCLPEAVGNFATERAAETHVGKQNVRTCPESCWGPATA